MRRYHFELNVLIRAQASSASNQLPSRNAFAAARRYAWNEPSSAFVIASAAASSSRATACMSFS